MLPPFHGERMAALRGEVEAIAGRAVARWPATGRSRCWASCSG